MLSIHFTAEDLARVHLDTSWGPLVETMCSLSVLQRRTSRSLVDGWRRGVQNQVSDQVRPLLALVQEDSFVDLFTLLGPSPSIHEATDRLLGLSDRHLRCELEPLRPVLSEATSWTRAWLRDLYRGVRGARQFLVSSLGGYSATAIEPYWSRIQAQLESERAMRGRLMTDGGVDELLGNLAPRIRWQPPVLEIARAGPPVDVAVAGRSLVLVPSVFADHVGFYESVVDEATPALLVYPARYDPGAAMRMWAPADTGRPLEALLGRTRAAALEAMADGCSTNELARRIHVSAATASYHASVLRNAGLVATHRNGTAVQHCLTELGAGLLRNGCAPVVEPCETSQA
ncbi:MAG: ArsR/SmtB family transcription factor [Acidimicrobiales bacterium]